jgi:hypothetical protein
MVVYVCGYKRRWHRDVVIVRLRHLHHLRHLRHLRLRLHFRLRLRVRFYLHLHLCLRLRLLDRSATHLSPRGRRVSPNVATRFGRQHVMGVHLIQFPK